MCVYIYIYIYSMSVYVRVYMCMLPCVCVCMCVCVLFMEMGIFWRANTNLIMCRFCSLIRKFSSLIISFIYQFILIEAEKNESYFLIILQCTKCINKYPNNRLFIFVSLFVTQLFHLPTPEKYQRILLSVLLLIKEFFFWLTCKNLILF